MKRQGTVEDPEDLDRMVKQGRLLPYERSLIPHLEAIKLEFKEALDDNGAGPLPTAIFS